uniref:Uncharacterized protein n=1 Tax=Anopheles atroparvus TaxID=41427 RepID=A0A182JB07_ANOAO
MAKEMVEDSEAVTYELQDEQGDDDLKAEREHLNARQDIVRLLDFGDEAVEVGQLHREHVVLDADVEHLCEGETLRGDQPRRRPHDAAHLVQVVQLVAAVGVGLDERQHHAVRQDALASEQVDGGGQQTRRDRGAQKRPRVAVDGQPEEARVPAQDMLGANVPRRHLPVRPVALGQQVLEGAAAAHENGDAPDADGGEEERDQHVHHVEHVALEVHHVVQRDEHEQRRQPDEQQRQRVHAVPRLVAVHADQLQQQPLALDQLVERLDRMVAHGVMPRHQHWGDGFPLCKEVEEEGWVESWEEKTERRKPPRGIMIEVVNQINMRPKHEDDDDKLPRGPMLDLRWLADRSGPFDLNTDCTCRLKRTSSRGPCLPPEVVRPVTFAMIAGVGKAGKKRKRIC